MNAFESLMATPWIEAVAIAFLIAGVVQFWRGLHGGAERARGLLLPDIGMLERMEGFRLMVFGLVLLGVGAAVLWNLPWLFYLALGIGFVEILESSTLIAVWRRGGQATRRTGA
jgi:hypothetical protein